MLIESFVVRLMTLHCQYFCKEVLANDSMLGHKHPVIEHTRDKGWKCKINIIPFFCQRTILENDGSKKYVAKKVFKTL